MKSLTLAGEMDSSLTVQLQGLSFPEFFKKRTMDLECRVFQSYCRYDAIIGRDLMSEIGVKLDFKNKLVQWDGMSVDMKVYERSYERKFGDGTKLVDLTHGDVVKGIYVPQREGFYYQPPQV